MAVNKTVFVLANYFLLAVNTFLSISTLRFIIEVMDSDESLTPLLPSIFCLLTIMINCLFNLVINYRISRHKAIFKQTINFYLISGICFILSILTILFYLILMYNDDLKTDPDSSSNKVLLLFIFILLITGLIITINQFRTIKYLKEINTNNLD